MPTLPDPLIRTPLVKLPSYEETPMSANAAVPVLPPFRTNPRSLSLVMRTIAAPVSASSPPLNLATSTSPTVVVPATTSNFVAVVS